jgi:G3E family GTPase
MSRRVLGCGGRAPIPITIVGGPAGGGKTTLLRQLLSRNDGRRVAVALDHPGSLRVDSSAIATSDGSALQLGNGSVCLGLDGEIATALARVQARQGLSDHVVIEAAPGASLLRMSGYAYMPGFRPGGCILVVGAPDVVRAQADDVTADAAFDGQLRHADLVVLNQVDRVPPAARRAARQWLQRNATRSRIVESEHCCVPTAMVLGIGLSDAPGHATLGEWTPGYGVDIAPRRSRVTKPRNNDDYRAWVLTTRRPIDVRAFRAWASTLPDSILRGDGVLHVGSEARHRLRFQLCGSRWSLSANEPAGPDLPSSWVSLVGLASFSTRSSTADDDAGDAPVVPESRPLRIQPREQVLTLQVSRGLS